MRTSKIRLENFGSGSVNFRAGGLLIDLVSNSVGGKAAIFHVTPDEYIEINKKIDDKYPLVKMTVLEQSEPLKVFLNSVNNGITTGFFQKITLPANVSCKAILIQVHAATKSDFTSFVEAPTGFHFSTSGQEDDNDFTVHIGSHTIDLERSENADIGYVRAAADKILVIEVIE